MTWEVYGLIDPRNSEVFYIGCSAAGAKSRAQAHRCDPASSAYRRYQEIITDDGDVGVCIFGTFDEKIEAKVLEGRLILAMPNVVNKKSFHGLPSSILYPGWQGCSLAAS